MTRIAGVDERMWIQLYMHNKPYIVKELDGLIADFAEYKEQLLPTRERVDKFLVSQGSSYEECKREKCTKMLKNYNELTKGK